MADRISYVGLDVHKDGIVVAIAVGGRRGEVSEYGQIANTAAALERLVRKLGGSMARPCDFAMRRGRAAMAFSVSCRGTGTNASWLPRR